MQKAQFYLELVSKSNFGFVFPKKKNTLKSGILWQNLRNFITALAAVKKLHPVPQKTKSRILYHQTPINAGLGI